MKYLIFFAFACFLLLLSCHPVHKIYIVRHAEKNKEPAIDPQLSLAGVQRSLDLTTLMKDKNIGYIFSTNTKRTKETGLPLSTLNNVPVQLYAIDTLKSFIMHLSHLKKNTLVIGHSNILLPMLNEFGVQHQIKAIGDYDYNNLFIVTIKNSKAIKVRETLFGAENPKN
jgi:hypothetical protein